VVPSLPSMSLDAPPSFASRARTSVRSSTLPLKKPRESGRRPRWRCLADWVAVWLDEPLAGAISPLIRLGYAGRPQLGVARGRSSTCSLMTAVRLSAIA
jgi:hypothetical protein